ncbi:helix-turn-helix transcriptional regulator [Frigidibacter sp. ROC022]|uniref:helix-turn-helix transcriptional regulator n=1 Tax=Frigidibacter sp. ROC022 TaxID=2971796 RepID=UPI00215A15C5|nr:YafY family protein [Frigidibacter sp. ROC022]MCR8724753.1 YafY family transcriptional regulator [Frigidibacter sp. ROC022]
MSKSDRLFRLLHLLRTLPAPVTAARLAGESGVSERTLYRDIETLRAGGALIDGAPGYGYTLTEDPALPPQMFTRLEVEALVLGLAEVQQAGDRELVDAAEAALAKIVATLPDRVQRQALHSVLQVYKWNRPPAPPAAIGTIREACWEERALDITYEDAQGFRSERRVWPLSVVFLDNAQALLAWCCLRQALRKFLLQRIVEVRETDESFRPKRVPLLREFLEQLQGG